MSVLSESPDHQEDTIFSMLEADQPLSSSQWNLSISRSPMSCSVTRRNEWVLLVAIFSFLRQVEGDLGWQVDKDFVIKLFIQ